MDIMSNTPSDPDNNLQRMQTSPLFKRVALATTPTPTQWVSGFPVLKKARHTGKSLLAPTSSKDNEQGTRNEPQDAE